MYNRSYGLVILIFFLLTAGACHTSRLTLSVLQPADTVLPASIQRISVIPMPGVSSSDQTVSRITDSYATRMGYIDGIYSILSSSPRFSKVVLSDTSTAWFVHDQEIHWEDLSEVSKHDQTDCVLLLSKAVSNESILFDANPEDDHGASIIQTRWLFCNPETQQTLARFSFTDTIVLSGVYQFDNLDNLLYRIYYATGEQCGKRLAPYWIDVDRLIYRSPGRDLRDAAILAGNNKWRNAGLLWNDLVTHKKVKISSRSAFNLALAFEREDDLDQAWLWIDYSDSLISNSLSLAYKKVLRKRLNDRELLIRQMEGNQ